MSFIVNFVLLGLLLGLFSIKLSPERFLAQSVLTSSCDLGPFSRSQGSEITAELYITYFEWQVFIAY